MEILESFYPRLNKIVEEEIFRDDDFEYVCFTDDKFILFKGDKCVGTLPIEEVQGYIVGKNKDDSYTSLSGKDLYEWEITIRDFIKRNKK